MAWSAYGWQAGPVGSLEALLDYCTFVRIKSESSTGKRGSNPVVQYRHGEAPTPRKYHRALNLVLETGIRYTDSSDAITHVDGEAGHVYENLGELKRLFAGTQAAFTRLQRSSPDHGTVYLDVEMLGDPSESQDRNVFTWPLHSPNPFWVGAVDLANASPTLTNDGTAPVGDLVVKFTGTTTDPRLTLTATGDYIQIDGALPAGGVEVNVAAGTCTKISGGADYINNLRVFSSWWLELDPGINTVAVTQASGTPTVAVDWITQWR